MRAGALAAATTALGWYLGTGLEPRSWITWLAAVPLLTYALSVRARTAACVALAAIALGGLNQWSYAHAVLHMPLPAIAAMVLMPAVVMAAGVGLMRQALGRSGPLLALWAVPLVWATSEWLVAQVSPHGAFWSLAYTQVDLLPVVQLASIGGPWSISFMLLLAASALALALHGGRAAASRVLPVAALLLCVQLGYGGWRLSTPAGDRNVTVALLSNEAAGLPSRLSDAEGRALLREYLAQLGTVEAADVIVLPENIVLVNAAERARLTADLQAIATAGRATIVAGAGETDTDAAANLALAIGADGSTAAYAKQHLLPGLEARFTAGSTDLLIDVADGVRAGVAICKDMDFPALARRHARAGASLMLVPAWDFVVDGELHARMAQLRGIESGMAVARSARGGRLTLSDAHGRRSVDVPADGARPALATIAVVSAPTWYARYGDVSGWVLLGLLVVQLGWLVRAGHPGNRLPTHAAGAPTR